MKPTATAVDASSTAPPNASCAADLTATTGSLSPAVESSAGGVAEFSIDDEFAEWDSIETIDAVADALAPLGEVIRLDATDDFPRRLLDARPDIVFNMAEGRRGPNRESHVPAILEFMGIPYSGSDPFTLSLCLDKARTKETLSYYGIPTAPFARITSLSQLDPFARRSFPAFVKPAHEGSSKGITERSICATYEDLREQVAHLLERYRQPALVESFLPGEEFTCAIMGNGDDLTVLPIIGMRFEELPPGAPPIFGFEAKWVWDTREHPLSLYECPARIDAGLRETLEHVAFRAYSVLGCRDWARVDLRLDERGVPNVVEVNPLPGIAPNPDDHSCFPMAARAAGIGYDELMQRTLLLAAARCGVELPSAPSYGRLARRTPPHGMPLRDFGTT
ncbi:MAG: D-alanine--D-alanine ligase [Gemmatimonadaceae bacterium]|nr:D-alanine--D-alanine ligase [Gemmatimonadaceae bacterium]